MSKVNSNKNDDDEVKDQTHYDVDTEGYKDTLNKEWYYFYKEIGDEKQVTGGLPPKQTVTQVWDTKIKTK